MSRPSAGIVLLARHASTRLPGKALARIGRETVLAHCLRRLMASQAGPVVLATTERADDDDLVSEAYALGIAVHRGSETNVLARMLDAAESLNCDVVVRATGDNPAVDPGAPLRVAAHLASGRADYVCESGLPVGAAVEGMSLDALRRCAREATEPGDLEHVTTFMKRHTDRFRLDYPLAPEALRQPNLRLTVDSADDLAYVRHLFAATGEEEPSVESLIRAAGSAHAEVA